MYSFSPSKQQWTIVLGLECINHGSVVIGNSVFLVGGDDNNTIEEYNISTKTFKKVSTRKNVRREFGISVINKSEVLIAGGRDNNYKETNKCFVFSTISKIFKDIAGMNTNK